MQGPRSIPPGRRGFNRPPAGGRMPGIPGGRQRDRTPFMPSRARRQEAAAAAHPPPPTAWIYLHGFASSPRSRKAAFFARKFQDAGLSMTVPDLNVPSFEELTITDMLAAIDGVAAEMPKDARIGIVGSSLGGLLAILTADRHRDRIARLLLLAPALGLFRANFIGIGRNGVKKWEEDGHIEVFHHGEDANRRISFRFAADAQHYDEDRIALDIPVTIVHGTRDETVDPHLSIVYTHRHKNARLHLVDDDHTLVTSVGQIWEWLWREIRPRGGSAHPSATET